MSDNIPDWARDSSAPAAPENVPQAAGAGDVPDWAQETAPTAAVRVSKPFKDEDFPEYQRLVRTRGTTPAQLSDWLEGRGYGRSNNAAEVLTFARRNPKAKILNAYTQNPADPAPAPDGMPQPGTSTDWLPDAIQGPIERLGLSLGIIDPKTYYGLGNYGPEARAPNRDTDVSSPALPSWGERFVRSMGETFDPAGGGINASILRANEDIADDNAIRRYGSDHNWTGAQIDAAIKRAGEDRAKVYAETREQRAIRDNDEVRREEGLGLNPDGTAKSSWSGSAKRGLADLAGAIVGDANPTYVFAPQLKGVQALGRLATPLVERGVAAVAPKAVPVVERAVEASLPTVGRMAGQGGVQAGTNVATQSDEASRGLKESVDPVEVILYGALGAGFQGGAEFLGKLTPQLSKWIVGKIKEPNALDRMLAEGFNPADLPEGVTPKDAMAAVTSLRGIRDEAAGSTEPAPSAATLNATAEAPRVEDSAPDAAPPPEPAAVPEGGVVTRLTDALNAAGKVRPEQDALYSAERAKRFAKVAAAQDAGGGRAAYEQSLAAMKGELPKADFEDISSQFTEKDIATLFDMVSSAGTLSRGEKLSAHGGLDRLLSGRLPQPKQLETLSRVFPSDFIKAAVENRTKLSKSIGVGSDLWNTFKTTQSTLDLSGFLRQGKGLIHRGEYWKAVLPSLKAVVSPKKSEELAAAIRSHPNYDLAKEAGLPVTTTGALGESEDMFRAHLVEKIPVWGSVIRGSERAYVGFLNKLRFDTFNSMLSQAKNLGYDLSDPVIGKGIARYIGVMTGRGGLGTLEKNSTALNNVFYSPGMISSRLQILAAPVQALGGKGMIGDLPKGMRVEAAKSYAAVLSYQASLIGLAAFAGKTVITDPRSSEFLKIKDGNTRLDLGGGINQYVVAGTRALLRETTSGGENGTSRELKGRGGTPLDNDIRFVVNKLHPSLTLILDQQRGETSVGEPFEWQKAVLSRLAPMGVPDIIETLKEHGNNPGAYYAVLGLLGEGLSNYHSKGDGPSPGTSAPVPTDNTEVPDWAKEGTP